MKKLYLEDVIEKYHLGGLVERVKLSITNKTLSTRFISTKKNLVGEITAPNVDLEDCEFGIYDTSQLLKLIGITDHFLVLNIEKQGKIVNKLLIADNEYNLEYVLADTMLTPAVPSIEEPTYDMVAPLNKDFISRFLKANKAINTDVFIVEQSVNTEEKFAVKFTLGGTEGYTNKINFTLPTTKHSIAGRITKFTLEEFSEILASNKEFKTGELSVSEDGLLKIEFENEEGVTASYILVGKE
jgi:hypothetical protein